MKILFVIDDLCAGGAQRQIVNLACSFKKKGHNVEIFIYHPGDHYAPILHEYGIPIKLYVKKSRYSFKPIMKLRQILCKEKYDIALSFLNTPNFYLEIAGIGINNTKILVSERFMYPEQNISRSLKILQLCHRLADAIIVNSHHQREKMTRAYPWMKKNIYTIYNGVNLDEFSPAHVIESGRNSHFKLLVVSSVAFKKNPLNLAKSLAYCRDNYRINIYVDWVGAKKVAIDGDAPLMETKKYLEEKDISHQWNWCDVRRDIPELLNTHDALIHPSFMEGLPNAVCEALACGRPVLVSDVCDHAMLIQDGVSGFLFDPYSPEDISRKIYQLWKMKQCDRDKMGSAARKYAEQNLSLEKCHDEYEKIFVGIME